MSGMDRGISGRFGLLSEKVLVCSSWMGFSSDKIICMRAVADLDGVPLSAASTVMVEFSPKYLGFCTQI